MGKHARKQAVRLEARRQDHDLVLDKQGRRRPGSQNRRKSYPVRQKG